MRVTPAQISDGIARYVDSELVPKMPGVRKWILGISGAYLGAMAEQKIRENEQMLRSIGIMSDDGMIDIDSLRTRLMSTASSTGPVTEHMPLFGDVTFNSSDVEKLFSFIAG